MGHRQHPNLKMDMEGSPFSDIVTAYINIARLNVEILKITGHRMTISSMKHNKRQQMTRKMILLKDQQ